MPDSAQRLPGQYSFPPLPQFPPCTWGVSSPRLSNSNSTCSEAKHIPTACASHDCATEFMAPPLPALRTRPKVPAKPADAQVPGFLGPTCPPLRSHHRHAERRFCAHSPNPALHHTCYPSSVLTTSLHFQPSVTHRLKRSQRHQTQNPSAHKPLDHLTPSGRSSGHLSQQLPLNCSLHLGLFSSLRYFTNHHMLEPFPVGVASGLEHCPVCRKVLG